MNLIRIAFELFALYVLYKLIFDFIIPLANTTKQVKKQFTDMNAQMQQKMKQQQNEQPVNNYSTSKTAPINKTKNDDYIEFEEIK
jgi:Sec-independent protein translocase protein TatA